VPLKDGVRLHMAKPLSVSIDKKVQAPVDFIVEGIMPLQENLKVPIKEQMDCTISMDKPLPLDMDLEFSMEDLGEGVRIGSKSEVDSKFK